jgi:DNA polymerase III delta subunit
MRFFEALKNLRSRVNNKYFLTGSETFLKRQFIQEAKTVYPELPCHTYLPEDEKNFISMLSSEDIFEQSSLIIVRDFNKMSSGELPDLLEKTGNVLIISSSEKADLKSKNISRCMGFVLPVECLPFPDYGKEYQLWLIKLISTAGYTMEEGVDEIIFSKIGPDFFSLDNETRKIFLYKTLDRHITKKDVELVVSNSVYGSPYDILDNILKKDITDAVGSFQLYMVDNSDCTGLVLFLIHYMEKMCRVAMLVEQKIPSDDIASILKISKYMLKTRYLARVNTLGLTQLAKIYDSLCTLDVQVRQFSGDKKRVVENYLFSVKGGL